MNVAAIAGHLCCVCAKARTKRKHHLVTLPNALRVSRCSCACALRVRVFAAKQPRAAMTNTHLKHASAAARCVRVLHVAPSPRHRASAPCNAPDNASDLVVRASSGCPDDLRRRSSAAPLHAAMPSTSAGREAPLPHTRLAPGAIPHHVGRASTMTGRAHAVTNLVL